MSPDEPRYLREFEVEIEEELTVARSSRPEDEFGLPPEQWQFDPIDEQREEVGLRNILGAAEGLEVDVGVDHGPDDA
jgi:hypothetical protein